MQIYLYNNNINVQKYILYKAKNHIISGNVLACSTDTVPGLLADCRNINSLHKIYYIKNRFKGKQCSVFVENINCINEFAYINNIEERILKLFFPGQITILLKTKNNSKYKNVTLWGNEIGVRIPNDFFILSLLHSLNFPLFATSLNVSGHDCLFNFNYFSYNMKKHIPMYVFNGSFCKKKASTVLRVGDNGGIEIIRDGCVSFEEICAKVFEK